MTDRILVLKNGPTLPAHIGRNMQSPGFSQVSPEDPAEGEALDRLNEIPISVSGLSFRYPQAETPALEDISFTIQAGERMGKKNEIDRAARQGEANTIAEQQPQRYNTLLTKEFTGGTELSGGECQSVAISRGFTRNAALVVLGEPTASLDPLAKTDVFRRFQAIAGERTTSVICHRLGSARLCDRVLVLSKGCAMSPFGSRGGMNGLPLFPVCLTRPVGQAHFLNRPFRA